MNESCDPAEIPSHPLAEKYPLMRGEDFEAFKASVAANGQQVEIELFEGKILDGRNRYRACRALGIEPKFKVFAGTAEQAAVRSDVLNLHRRHLTREQMRAVIAYKVAESPDRSDRDIAAEVKVSPTTVAAVRKSVAPTVQLGQLPTTRVGRDGKRRAVAAVPKVEPRPDPAPVAEPDPDTDPSARKVRGRGIELANEAINSLIRIPKNDELMARGFEIVADWIDRNRPKENVTQPQHTGSPAREANTPAALAGVLPKLDAIIKEAQKSMAARSINFILYEVSEAKKAIETHLLSGATVGVFDATGVVREIARKHLQRAQGKIARTRKKYPNWTRAESIEISCDELVLLMKALTAK